MRQAHVLLPFFFFNDNDLLPSDLPPVLLLFLLISSRLMITASPSLSSVFPLVRLCLIPVVSCLLYRLILCMTKRQSRHRIGADR